MRNIIYDLEFIHDILQKRAPVAALGGIVVFGLGLTSVRAVIEAHGGSLAAFSAGAGRGSQFTILLPMVALPDQG